VLVASYDLLLGYTGIVSFAHTMFYGIGAYGVGLTLHSVGPTWGAVFMGLTIALLLSLALALVIGLFSLRVKAIFYAMITLAVASAFAVLAPVVGLHRRRGRPHLRRARAAAARLPPGRGRDFRHRHQRQADHLLPGVLLGAGAVPAPAAGGQFALRPRAAGDPRERFPRRGARLPHSGVPHPGQLPPPWWRRWPAR
jgi:hypothetical protein